MNGTSSQNNGTKNIDKTSDNETQATGPLVEIKADNSKLIDPEDEKTSRNAMAMILDISKSSNPLTNQKSASNFYMQEQKQKNRKKSIQVMLVYNEKNNNKYKKIFQRFQQKRTQSAEYSGRHDDYTSYFQNFQSAKSR